MNSHNEFFLFSTILESLFKLRSGIDYFLVHTEVVRTLRKTPIRHEDNKNWLNWQTK